MNNNQQAEIEELFKRVNKNMQKSNKSKIGDEDLNKVRAFVVQSQRPLQAVRLLQKEREERETDESFTSQKEEIIGKARELDRQRQEYKDKQQEMIAEVTRKTVILQANAAQKLNQQQKADKEQAAIDIKRTELQVLVHSLNEKEKEYRRKEEDIERHKEFTDFLESVVKDKAGTSEGFTSIDDLQGRYKNLKNENKNLITRKIAINKQMEDIKLMEKKKMNDLKNQLFEETRKQQIIQSQNELISSKNQILEQDFEIEIQKKNQSSKEIGQIINSIGNIANICKVQQTKRGKKLNNNDIVINETTPNLVDELVVKLEKAHQTIHELVQVHEVYGDNYDREKAYAEEIDYQAALNQPKKHESVRQPGNQAQQSTIGGGSTGGRTGKLNTQGLGFGESGKSGQ